MAQETKRKLERLKEAMKVNQEYAELEAQIRQSTEANETPAVKSDPETHLSKRMRFQPETESREEMRMPKEHESSGNTPSVKLTSKNLLLNKPAELREGDPTQLEAQGRYYKPNMMSGRRAPAIHPNSPSQSTNRFPSLPPASSPLEVKASTAPPASSAITAKAKPAQPSAPLKRNWADYSNDRPQRNPETSGLLDYYIVFPMPQQPAHLDSRKVIWKRFCSDAKIDGWFCFHTFCTSEMCPSGRDCYYRHGWFSEEEAEVYMKYAPAFYSTAYKHWAKPQIPIKETVIWPKNTHLRGEEKAKLPNNSAPPVPRSTTAPRGRGRWRSS